MLKEGIILDLIAGIQVHLVSFAILIIIYTRLRKEAQAYSLQDRLFKYLTLSTMLPIILKAITRVVDAHNIYHRGDWYITSIGMILQTIFYGISLIWAGGRHFYLNDLHHGTESSC